MTASAVHSRRGPDDALHRGHHRPRAQAQAQDGDHLTNHAQARPDRTIEKTSPQTDQAPASHVHHTSGTLPPGPEIPFEEYRNNLAEDPTLEINRDSCENDLTIPYPEPIRVYDATTSEMIRYSDTDNGGRMQWFGGSGAPAASDRALPSRPGQSSRDEAPQGAPCGAPPWAHLTGTPAPSPGAPRSPGS